MSLKFAGRWILTNESIDRDGDIVRAAGGRVKDYEKNPILLYNHYGKSIGRVENLELVDNSWKGDIYVDVGSPEGADCYRRIQLKTLNMVSIRFIAHKWYQMESGGYDIVEWELIETSLADIPSNRETGRDEMMEKSGVKTIIKSFTNKNHETMELKGIIDAFNRILGKKLDPENATQEDVEKALAEVATPDERLSRSLKAFQGSIETSVSKKISEATDSFAKKLEDAEGEITQLKTQLKELQEAKSDKDAEDGDGGKFSKKNSGEEIFDLDEYHKKTYNQ